MKTKTPFFSNPPNINSETLSRLPKKFFENHIKEQLPKISSHLDRLFKETHKYSVFPKEWAAILRANKNLDWTVYYAEDNFSELITIISLAFLYPRPPKPKSNFAFARRLKYLSEDQPEVLLRFKAWSNDFLAMIFYRHTITELLSRAKKGDIKALQSILEVDKTISFQPWFQEKARKAQLNADWRFFDKVGTAIAKPPFTLKKKTIKIAFLAMFFWNQGLKYLSYSKTFELFQKFNLYGEDADIGDAESLRIFLNRLGLKKFQKIQP